MESGKRGEWARACGREQQHQQIDRTSTTSTTPVAGSPTQAQTASILFVVKRQFQGARKNGENPILCIWSTRTHTRISFLRMGRQGGGRGKREYLHNNTGIRGNVLEEYWNGGAAGSKGELRNADLKCTCALSEFLFLFPSYFKTRRISLLAFQLAYSEIKSDITERRIKKKTVQRALLLLKKRRPQRGGQTCDINILHGCISSVQADMPSTAAAECRPPFVDAIVIPALRAKKAYSPQNTCFCMPSGVRVVCAVLCITLCAFHFVSPLAFAFFYQLLHGKNFRKQGYTGARNSQELCGVVPTRGFALYFFSSFCIVYCAGWLHEAYRSLS